METNVLTPTEPPKTVARKPYVCMISDNPAGIHNATVGGVSFPRRRYKPFYRDTLPESILNIQHLTETEVAKIQSEIGRHVMRSRGRGKNRRWRYIKYTGKNENVPQEGDMPVLPHLVFHPTDEVLKKEHEDVISKQGELIAEQSKLLEDQTELLKKLQDDIEHLKKEKSDGKANEKRAKGRAKSKGKGKEESPDDELLGHSPTGAPDPAHDPEG